MASEQPSQSSDSDSSDIQIPWLYRLFSLPPQIKNFILFWFGQSLSQIGTRLTGFGLGIWVYQNTQAVTQLSLVFFITMLPGVVLTPLVGALVDRWNRRWIIFFSDCGAAVVTAALLLLQMSGSLQIWHTYISAFATSLCGCFQMVAKGAAIPMMVSKQQLGRVNGMLQFSSALSEISAPALAGFLVGTLNLSGLLCLDLGSYAIGLSTLLFVSIPQPEPDTSSFQDRSLLKEIFQGWNVISSQVALLILLGFMGLYFFVNGMAQVLLNPLVLSFSSAQTFGSVMSLGGIGMVIGSILMSIWGGGHHALQNLFVASFIGSVGLVIAGTRQSIPIISLGLFISFLTLPIIMGTSQTIWQRCARLSHQGRVLSLVGTFTGLLATIGTISASPLADVVLEPMLAKDGLLASTVGQLIGIGGGRGIGFLMILAGSLLAIVSLAVYVYVRCLNLDSTLLESQEIVESEPLVTT
ncbi:MFS transporter [Leptolyngbya cf. ectocarpi LEGE 11479]|uniref:MFS transporter n=1 Tax=Leptolyngbya cf. ectocarpi LEGE 11479 TaxID=1828722 RepID=A0A928ZYU3_LEPEC|nr:MFS transporter [Leptolyngbya ectocarpi]MBE9069957.1 MFS transporter [Leptolyngbya cf. ectocarpi LEGE 11479]